MILHHARSSDSNMKFLRERYRNRLSQIAPMVVLSRLLPLLLPISGCQSLSNHHTCPFCSDTGYENYSRSPNTDGKSPPCGPTKSLVSSSKNSSAGRTALLVDRTGGGSLMSWFVLPAFVALTDLQMNVLWYGYGLCFVLYSMFIC
jgi:hypothetical protein